MRKSGRNTSSKIARAALVMAACLGLAVVTSCFQTREAVPPTTVGNAPVPPLTVYDVIYNLELAVKSQNPVFYEELFAESFLFKPDRSDSIEVEKNFPGAYANWNYDIETGVMEYILDPVRCKLARLNLPEVSEVIVDFTDTTYIIQRDYDLILVYGGEDDEGDTSTGYYGTARFFLRKLPDGYWYIERWVDYLNESQATSWGRLKGESRARM
jgi:hypothetical protein